ncbi:riboflavin kinase [Trametes meyenii]|nr:riboflavin kinase [Trametes meyenii]
MAFEERASAPVRIESFRADRPEVVGPEVPHKPFPIYLSGAVQHGFGRGGKDLGCPTANLPDESIASMTSVTDTGVYYGYAQVSREKGGNIVLPEEEGKVLPMVMSLGLNPFYNNKSLTAEIHIMHNFKSDFYGHSMKAIVLGYIRPELNYTSREALIEDIETDKRVAVRSLTRQAYDDYRLDPYFDLNGSHPRL